MRRPRLLGNRDFRLLWAGETLSELGSQSASVAYPLLILALTGSPAKAGVVGLAKWLPLTLFSLPAGVLADRFDRKRLMIACDAVRMLAAASIVLALALGRPAYAQVVVVAFLDGCLFITSYICERGALRQVVPAEQLHDAVATNEARTFAAGLVGPSLGGALFGVTRALPFIADACSFACSTAAILATRARFQLASTEAARPSWRRAGAEVGDGIRWLRSQPFFRTTGLLAAAGNPVYTGLYLLAILLARRDHASPALIGAMLSVVGGFGLFGAILAGAIRRRTSVRAIVIGEQWVLLGAVLLLLVARNPLLIGALVGLAEFSTPAANAVVAGSRVAAAPDHLQGRVQAAASTLAMSLAWLGPLAVGALFEGSGATATTLVMACWTLAMALAATLAPSIRHHAPVVPKPFSASTTTRA